MSTDCGQMLLHFENKKSIISWFAAFSFKRYIFFRQGKIKTNLQFCESLLEAGHPIDRVLGLHEEAHRLGGAPIEDVAREEALGELHLPAVPVQLTQPLHYPGEVRQGPRVLRLVLTKGGKGGVLDKQLGWHLIAPAITHELELFD